MTTPLSGNIAISDISSALSRAATSTTSLGEASVRDLLYNNTAALPVSMAFAYGKPQFLASRFLLPGIYTYSPPNSYTNLTVTLVGGGAGGGGANTVSSGSSGTNGGQSSFGTTTPVIANGGTGGSGGTTSNDGASGSDGTGSGGDYSFTEFNGGVGGTSATGGNGGDGGDGNIQKKSWLNDSVAGSPQGNGPFAQNYTVVVGAGGAGGAGAVGAKSGTAGSSGYVLITRG